MDAEEERKRRAELDTAWEEAREDRVQGWRSFNKTTKRRKKGPPPRGRGSRGGEGPAAKGPPVSSMTFPRTDKFAVITMEHEENNLVRAD